MDLLGAANKGIRQLLIARGVQSATVTIDGHPVHYYRLRGSGTLPPVVLVHGLGGSANGFYKTFFSLAKRFSDVWALDIPGNGFSPLPAGGPLGIEPQVRLLAAFLEAQVKQKVFLVGNSLGGAMALFLAHERPDLLRGLALVAPAGARWSEARLNQLKASFQIRNRSQARAMTRRLFHKAPVSLLVFAGQLQTMYAAPAVTSVLQAVKAEDAATPEQLQGLKPPTLLLWGKSEKLLPYESIHYFREHLPKGTEIHEVEGFGHIPQMERPKELVALLEDFAERKLR